MRYALAFLLFALPMFGETTETIVVACSGPCSLASEPTSPWDLWNEILEPAENLVRFSLADDQVSPEFAQWCAERSFAPADYKQMACDAFWVLLSDSRSHALMIRALDNPDWNVVAYAIYGLGVQKDETSRPLIEKSVARFPDHEVALREFIKEGFGNEETSR